MLVLLFISLVICTFSKPLREPYLTLFNERNAAFKCLNEAQTAQEMNTLIRTETTVWNKYADLDFIEKYTKKSAEMNRRAKELVEEVYSGLTVHNEETNKAEKLLERILESFDENTLFYFTKRIVYAYAIHSMSLNDIHFLENTNYPPVEYYGFHIFFTKFAMKAIVITDEKFDRFEELQFLVDEYLIYFAEQIAQMESELRNTGSENKRKVLNANLKISTLCFNFLKSNFSYEGDRKETSEKIVPFVSIFDSVLRKANESTDQIVANYRAQCLKYDYDIERLEGLSIHFRTELQDDLRERINFGFGDVKDEWDALSLAEEHILETDYDDDYAESMEDELPVFIDDSLFAGKNEEQSEFADSESSDNNEEGNDEGVVEKFTKRERRSMKKMLKEEKERVKAAKTLKRLQDNDQIPDFTEEEKIAEEEILLYHRLGSEHANRVWNSNSKICSRSYNKKDIFVSSIYPEIKINGETLNFLCALTVSGNPSFPGFLSAHFALGGKIGKRGKKSTILFYFPEHVKLHKSLHPPHKSSRFSHKLARKFYIKCGFHSRFFEKIN